MQTPGIITIGLVATAAAIAPTTALAKHGGDDDVRVRGTCTKGSSAKLKLANDDNRIETEFEVDQNRNGVRWKVVLRRNGRQVASTTATTRARAARSSCAACWPTAPAPTASPRRRPARPRDLHRARHVGMTMSTPKITPVHGKPTAHPVAKP